MRARRYAVPIACLAGLATFVPVREAEAQVLVLPRRADKAQVRRFDFAWRFVDVPLAGGPAGAPEPSEGGHAPGAPATPTPPGEGPAPGSSAPPGEGNSPSPTPGTPTGPGGGAASAPYSIDPRTVTGRDLDQAIRDRLPDGAADNEGVGPMGAPVGSATSGSPTKAADVPGDKKPGLRLYFYERERDVAELAIPLIAQAHEYLRQQFEYTPSERFPYILYNTYQEFLETRLFQVQEGILGVTSPIDLTLTLPYFGDHKRFSEVSTHEMAHQFTIQKLRDIAKREKTDSPIERMPLWFIEGLAEFYAQHGIDPETEMLARDIVVNPDGERGYALLDFFEDRPGSVLWTYKVGQARCAFLDDTFGAGTIQRILERAHYLSGGRSFSSGGEGSVTFPRLLERVTGESKDVLAAHFADWLKKRAFRTYLDSKQSAATLVPLGRELADDPILGMVSSPDGELLLFRRIDLTIGQTQLVLLDRRDRRRSRLVSSDGEPGAESLHPVSPRNFSLVDNALVYTAQVDSRDVIYWQAIDHRVKAAEAKPSPRRFAGGPGFGNGMGRVGGSSRMPPSEFAAPDEKLWDVSLSLGERIEIDVGPVVSVESPTLSPDGSRVAFIGTDETGFRDLYVVDLREPSHPLQRLTNDRWTERQASWGRDGIVYTSDATQNGKFNLFTIDPDKGTPPVRLTMEDRDESDPLATADGRVFFVAYQDARADLHEVVQGRVVRRTDVVTGITDVSVGPEGGLWGLWLHSGRHIPVRIARTDLMDLPTPGLASYGAPEAMTQYHLGGDSEQVYSASSPSNWRLGPIFGLLGAGSGFIFGQVYASATDLMRDDVLVLNLNIWGNFDLTDGLLMYINQAGKVAWGAGAFQSLNYRLDRTLEGIPGGPDFTSYERFFGVMGLVRFPFSTFQYIEASLAVGGTRYFLYPGQDLQLRASGYYDYWAQRNQSTYAQVEGTVTFGHDTIRYHMLTGPLDGSSLLAEVSAAVQPQRSVTYGDVRLDAAKYLALGGSAKIFARAGVGTSFGGKWAREFYLSSFDTVRGVRYGTDAYLLGQSFYFSTLQLQFPLGAVIRVLFLPNIEGVAGFDFGGVGDTAQQLWQKRVFDGVLGVNLVFGPLVFRVHFAKPINTGAHPERLSTPVTPLTSAWVTNLSLSWLGF
jgi:hypothetical protein